MHHTLHHDPLLEAGVTTLPVESGGPAEKWLDIRLWSELLWSSCSPFQSFAWATPHGWTFSLTLSYFLSFSIARESVVGKISSLSPIETGYPQGAREKVLPDPPPTRPSPAFTEGFWQFHLDHACPPIPPSPSHYHCRTSLLSGNLVFPLKQCLLNIPKHGSSYLLSSSKNLHGSVLPVDLSLGESHISTQAFQETRRN